MFVHNSQTENIVLWSPNSLGMIYILKYIHFIHSGLRFWLCHFWTFLFMENECTKRQVISLKVQSWQFVRDFPREGFRTPHPPSKVCKTQKCAKLKVCKTHLHSARTVYWRTQARGKRKNIMRFEIRYFFLEIGLSPLTFLQL